MFGSNSFKDLFCDKVIAEFTDDEWNQTSLTLEGNFNDTSFTYAGTFFDRDVRYLWDYNDYVEYYQLDSTGVNGFGYASYYTCDYYDQLCNSVHRNRPRMGFLATQRSPGQQSNGRISRS